MTVLVVGFGFAGASVAHFLCQNDIKVSVVNYPAYDLTSSTNVSAGVIVPLTGRRKVPVFNSIQTIDFAWRHYQELEHVSNIKLIQNRTVVEIIHDFKSYNDWFAKSFESIYSYTIEKKDFLECLDLEREGFVIYENAGCIIPKSVIEAYRLTNPTIGHIDSHFEYDQMKCHDGRIFYQEREYSAVVFCDGHRVTSNPYWKHLPFRPVKGEILDIYAPEFNMSCILNGDLYIVPYGEGKFRVGATYNWNDLDELPSDEGRTELVQKLDKLIPCDYQITEHRASIRPAIQDRRPVIGKHPDYDAVWIFNGLGTKGALYSPYYGEQLVKSMLGLGEIDPDVNVERFK